MLVISWRARRRMLPRQSLMIRMADTEIFVVLLNTGLIRTQIREKSRVQYTKWIAPLVEASAFRTFYRQVIEPRLFGPYKKDPMEMEVEEVTKIVMRALEAPTPAVRYFITPLMWVLGFLVRVLPSRWFDRFLLFTGALSGGKRITTKASAAAALHPPDIDAGSKQVVVGEHLIAE